MSVALDIALALAGKAAKGLWWLAATPTGRIVLALLLAALFVAAAYLCGRHAGRAALAAELAADRITILKDGKAIDNEVLAADDPALCALLGGCVQPDAD